MTATNISLPDTLKQLVDSQVATKKTIPAERQLIRRDQDRAQLRNLLLQGAQPASSGFADEAYFASSRSGINSR